METTITLLRAFSYLATLALLMVGKLSAMRAHRLYKYQPEKEEKENHSLRYAFMGCITMFIYLVIFFYDLIVNLSKSLCEIPLTLWGATLVLLILNMDDIRKIRKNIMVLFVITVISTVIFL